MLVTEEEAKTKWCPDARAIVFETPEGGAHSSGNRLYAGNGKVDPDCLCVTSKCMAWRWANKTAFKTLGELDKNPDAGNLGYCGKAGKP